jgi:alpha-beta hydrolase superfamily lysophospholipase
MAPTALLLIPAEKDNLVPIEAVKTAYERAREPKAISVLPITHFEAYHDPWWLRANVVKKYIQIILIFWNYQ